MAGEEDGHDVVAQFDVGQGGAGVFVDGVHQHVEEVPVGAGDGARGPQSPALGDQRIDELVEDGPGPLQRAVDRRWDPQRRGEGIVGPVLDGLEGKVEGDREALADEIATKLDIQFYGDAREALLKALVD